MISCESKKQSRRSKNDTEGRNFSCSYCEKKYLSNPALWTHIKQKHPGQLGQVNFNMDGVTDKKGRGRPRKIII